VDDLEAARAKDVGDPWELQSCDNVPRLLTLGREAKPDGKPRDRRIGRLRDTDGVTRDASHLRQACLWPLDVMEAVVNEDNTERVIGKRETLDIGDDGGNVEAVALRSFGGSSGRARRDVGGNHPGTSPREELSIEP
jgi:hypothetical protein